MPEALPSAPISGTPLLPDDPKFTRFETAVMLEERVRVTYREERRHDPATESLGKWITTLVEGQAMHSNPDQITIIPLMENGREMGLAMADGTFVKRQLPGMQMMTRVIARADVLNLEFMGPRPVEPREEA